MSKNIAGIRQLKMPGMDSEFNRQYWVLSVFRNREAIDDGIRKADLAMYQAKAQGRNQLVVYEPALENKSCSLKLTLID